VKGCALGGGWQLHRLCGGGWVLFEKAAQGRGMHCFLYWIDQAPVGEGLAWHRPYRMDAS